MTLRLRHRGARRTRPLRLRLESRHALPGASRRPAGRRRMVLAVLAAIVICASGAGLAIALSGPSPSDVVRKDLTRRLERIRTVDKHVVADIEKSSSEQFKQVGVDSEKFAGGFLDKFSYKIGAIKVDGDTATAHVKVTSKKLSTVLAAFSTDFQDKTRSAATPPNQEQLAALAGAALMKAAEDAAPEPSTCSFIYHRAGGGVWKPDGSWRTELARALGSPA